MEEREVSLFDLVTDFLLQWRKIVLLIIIGAVLGGVVSLASSIITNKEQTSRVVQAEKELENYKADIENGEEVDVSELERLQSIVDKGVSVGPGISAKYILSCAVMAVLLYAVFFFMLYVTNDKVRMTDEWDELYNIPHLGIVCKQKKQGNVWEKIDKWLLHLKCKREFEMSEVETLKLAYVSLKLMAQKEGYEKLSLVGCNIKGFSQHVCEQLKGALEKDNIQVEILNDLIYDPHVMNKLKNVQGVILIGRIGSTTYKEIYKELDLLMRLDVAILGGLIIE